MFIWNMSYLYKCLFRFYIFSVTALASKGYEVSKTEVKWDEIDTVCQRPFGSRLFTSKVNDELRRSIPVNEKFWIQAKAKPTNYLYWRGCHLPVKDTSALEPRQLANNSVVSCIRNTNCHTYEAIALKGETCLCLDLDDINRYFRLNPSTVTQFCTGNMNDECGCSNGGYSLYQITSDTDKGADCITQTLKMNPLIGGVVPHSGVRRCDNKNVIDSYRCWDGRAVRYFRNTVNLTWYEARRRCWQKGFELAVGRGKSRNTFIGREFWTEMRRSFSLSWTKETDANDKNCVAVYKDEYDKLHLKENSCSSDFKVLCRKTVSENSRFPVSAVVIPVVVVFIVAVVVIFIVVFERRQRLRRKLLPSVNNRFYDQVVCSSVQNTSRGHTSTDQTPIPVDDDVIYHTIDDQAGNQRAEGTERHYHNVAFQSKIEEESKSNEPQKHEYDESDIGLQHHEYEECGISGKMVLVSKIEDSKDKLSTRDKEEEENIDNDTRSGKNIIRADFDNFENHYDVSLVT